MICQKCKDEFSERPAVSRRESKILICPICASKEAIEDTPWDEDSKKEALEEIENLWAKYREKNKTR